MKKHLISAAVAMCLAMGVPMAAQADSWHGKHSSRQWNNNGWHNGHNDRHYNRHDNRHHVRYVRPSRPVVIAQPYYPVRYYQPVVYSPPSYGFYFRF